MRVALGQFNATVGDLAGNAQKMRSIYAEAIDAEVDLLVGDPSKAQCALGWKPQVSFEGLVQMMVEADLKYLGKEVL